MTAQGLGGAVPVLVVDASVAVDMLAGSEKALTVVADVVARSGQLLVPAHFWAEVANALMKRARPAIENGIDVRSLADIGIEVADRGIDGLVDAMGLGERHRLTAYDALYLQLALDVDGSLATFDQDLAAAARREGVTVVP